MSTASQYGSAPTPTVLLVDTDADTRDMYELAFALDGFRTVSTASAFEGFAAALDLEPAVIVTDLGPPGRSHAFEMLGWLHTDEQTRNIPVVAVTGYELTGEALRASFAHVLLKPVAPDALVASARAAAGRSAQLRDRAQRVRARIPDVLQRSHRALRRSAQLTQAHAAKLRCPRCKALLTRTFDRVTVGSTLRQYRPCRNGCGLFYYDPVTRRITPLL
jgi:CheY-like chemotaxis protein